MASLYDIEIEILKNLLFVIYYLETGEIRKLEFIRVINFFDMVKRLPTSNQDMHALTQKLFCQLLLKKVYMSS